MVVVMSSVVVVIPVIVAGVVVMKLGHFGLRSFRVAPFDNL